MMGFGHCGGEQLEKRQKTSTGTDTLCVQPSKGEGEGRERGKPLGIRDAADCWVVVNSTGVAVVLQVGITVRKKETETEKETMSLTPNTLKRRRC
jgi:hypothetical protein